MKEVTIKTCYVYAILWLCVTTPVTYALILFATDLNPDLTKCAYSGYFNKEVCPSTTDFAPNGKPYAVFKDTNELVVYPPEHQYAGKTTMEIYYTHVLPGVITFAMIDGAMVFLAWWGMNSHYKLVKVNFVSCERKKDKNPNDFGESHP